MRSLGLSMRLRMIAARTGLDSQPLKHILWPGLCWALVLVVLWASLQVLRLVVLLRLVGAFLVRLVCITNF